MNTLYVKHPNPTLNLPVKKLYNHCRNAIGFQTPSQSIQNVTYSTHTDMFKCAIKRATDKPSLFVLVAWGFVNGNTIDPIGFLCFDKGAYLFTPLNTSNEDFKANRDGKTPTEIVYQINDDYRKDPLNLIGKRGWLSVDKTKGESFDASLLNRVSHVFCHALFSDFNSLDMAQLYEMAG